MTAETRSDNEEIRVCALVAYDGTNYCGSQFQTNAPTIQGELERALHDLLGVERRLVASGRTDTGVHATGQVIAVTLPWRHPLVDLQRAWTRHLPDDIALHRLSYAPDDFHPRYSAYSRSYRYAVVAQAKPKDHPAQKFLPLHERFALYVPKLLDVDSMNYAAQEFLVGEHDFASYGRAPHGNNTVRRIMQAEWHTVENGLLPLSANEQTQYLSFTITATAFLRQMVRNIVGTLLQVGVGKRTADDVERILLARERSQSGPPAPAQGLVLERVSYPDFPTLFTEI